LKLSISGCGTSFVSQLCFGWFFPLGFPGTQMVLEMEPGFSRSLRAAKAPAFQNKWGVAPNHPLVGWIFHGFSMDFPWLIMDFPWLING